MRFVSALAVTLLATLCMSQSARAYVVTFDDDLHFTIVRPTTGTASAQAVGHYTLDDGYALGPSSIDTAFDTTGDGVFGLPAYDPTLAEVFFAVTIGATQPLGLYDTSFFAGAPASFTLTECPVVGGQCIGATFEYSVDVVDSLPVPEPGTLALIGVAALAGIAVRRRRRYMV